MKAVLLAGLAFLTSSVAAHACGIDTDCRLGDRLYRIAMPSKVPEGQKIGAIIYAHGYRGKAHRVMRNKGLLKAADELGVALIAVQSAGDDWSIPGAPSHSAQPAVDELGYFDQVIEDATTQFPIDRDRLMVTGFSAGGMMVWNLACDRGKSFAGFAPMAGTFWRPIPTHCPGAPVNMFHYHGTNDLIVPIAGRPIGDTHQGNVGRAAELLIRDGGYSPQVEIETDEGLNCRRGIAKTGDGEKKKVFDICLHEGKHEFKTLFVKRSWIQLQEIGAL